MSNNVLVDKTRMNRDLCDAAHIYFKQMAAILDLAAILNNCEWSLAYINWNNMCFQHAKFHAFIIK